MALTNDDILKIRNLLKNLATKNELGKIDEKGTRLDSRVTKLDAKVERLDAKVDKLVEEVFETKMEIKELKEGIKGLPTRREFFDMVSKVMGELQTTRDEHIILDGQVSRHAKQIEKLEDIHPHSQHSTA
ncbi:hypothetical protein HYZ78_01410 [Candidatus Microgenomates bacterium]|nr:hypothetical protein [Candidatus Microgenomates bacterium]